MKAYRFNAVYDDILLCEFLISDTSDFNFLAQNLCKSIKAEYKKDCIYVYTKKKRQLWEKDTRLFLDGLNKPLNELSLRSGRKILVTFDEKTLQGIEIQYMLKCQFDKPESSKKTNSTTNQFEILILNKLLNQNQLYKIGLIPTDTKARKTNISETSKDQPESKKNKKNKKNPKNIKKNKISEKDSEFDAEELKKQVIVETVERKLSVNRSFDEDFVDNMQDLEAQFDFDVETMLDFNSNNYTDEVDEEDDEEVPDDFSSDDSSTDDENLEETLDDIEDEEYIYNDDAYDDDDDLYPEDDEDFMEKYDKIDDEEEFFQRDDYEYYYEDDQDDDDYDKY